MPIRSSLALLCLFGCATLHLNQPAAPAAKVAAAAAPGAKPGSNEGCGFFTGEPVKLAPDADVEYVVRATACTGPLVRPADAADRWYVRRNQTFDDRTASAVDRAAMVVACVADGSCDPAVDPESFAYIEAYASGLDVTQVEAQLQGRVPPGIVSLFVTRVSESLAALDTRAAALDSRRRALLVDLPRSVEARRMQHIALVGAYSERTDKALAEIDATLVDLPVPDVYRSLAKNARTLRDEVLLRCLSKRPLRECMDGPLVRPLTERLIELAIRDGDAPQAAAEYEQLLGGHDCSRLGAELATTISEGWNDYQALVGRYETQRKEGTMGEDLMVAAFGNPPPSRLPALAWRADDMTADYGAQIRALAPTQKIAGVVLGSRGRGNALEIDIAADRPVLIALSEARLLRIGDRLEAMVDRQSRRGVVVSAFRDRPTERVVQVRGTRLVK